MLIRDVLFFSNHNGDWIKFPARQYEKDGETKYFSYFMLTNDGYEETQKEIANAMRREMQKETVQAQQNEVDF